MLLGLKDLFIVRGGAAHRPTLQCDEDGFVVYLMLLVAYCICVCFTTWNYGRTCSPVVLETIILLARVMVGNSELLFKGDQAAAWAGFGGPHRSPNGETSSHGVGSQQRRKDRVISKPTFAPVPFFSVCAAAFLIVSAFTTLFCKTDACLLHSTRIAFGLSMVIIPATLTGRKAFMLAGGCYLVYVFWGPFALYVQQFQESGTHTWWHSLYSRYSTALALTVLLMDVRDFTQCQLGRKCVAAFPALEKLVKIIPDSSSHGDDKVWGVSISYVCFVCSITTMTLCLWASSMMLERSLDVSCTGVFCALVVVLKIADGCLAKGFMKALRESFPLLTISALLVAVVYYCVPVESHPIVAGSMPCSMVVVYIANRCPCGSYSETIFLLMWLTMFGSVYRGSSFAHVIEGRYVFPNQMLHLVTIGVGFHTLFVLGFATLTQGSHPCSGPLLPLYKRVTAILRELRLLNKGRCGRKEERNTRSSPPPQTVVERSPLRVETRGAEKNGNSTEGNLYVVSSELPSLTKLVKVEAELSAEISSTTEQPSQEDDEFFGVVHRGSTGEGVKRLECLVDHGSAVESTQGVSQHESPTATPILVHEGHFNESHMDAREEEAETTPAFEDIREMECPKKEMEEKVMIILEERQESRVRDVADQSSEMGKRKLSANGNSKATYAEAVLEDLQAETKAVKLITAQQKAQQPEESLDKQQLLRESGLSEPKKNVLRASTSAEGSLKRSGDASERVPVGAVVKMSRQHQATAKSKKESTVPLPKCMVTAQEMSSTPALVAADVAVERPSKKEVKHATTPKRNTAEVEAEKQKGTAKGVNQKGGKILQDEPAKKPRAVADSLKQKEKVESRRRKDEKDPTRCTSDSKPKQFVPSLQNIGAQVGDNCREDGNANDTKTTTATGVAADQPSCTSKNSAVASETRECVAISIPQPRSWSSPAQNTSLVLNPIAAEANSRKTTCWNTSSVNNGCETAGFGDQISLLGKTSSPWETPPSLGESPLAELSQLYLTAGPMCEAPQGETTRSIPLEARNALENFAKAWEPRENVTHLPRESGLEGGSPQKEGKRRQSVGGVWAGIPLSVATDSKGLQLVNHEAASSPNIFNVSEPPTTMSNSGMAEGLEHQTAPSSVEEHHFARLQYPAAQQAQLLMMADGRLAMYPVYSPPYVHQAVVMSPPHGGAAVPHHHVQHQQSLAFYPQVVVPVSQMPSGTWSPYAQSPGVHQ
ncbi:hypothetical protein, conserved [Trypanosoma brucei gambiense DAL972]|uniref:Uncharacterized protein n=1 Tax=Trypanosoma brucei gambiense (strain MHOM/CI/86/DAL972) TaxID=679716 RepID=D0A4D8_TRYB9|nr:hypothetical protein, conserved [Trypanosoma brucei gambiense DAL972]CBH16132.1 hypothetical protein, conserved [Trypanosoma brucei gambiense DAL972]|eukprot:XP_011778396.1 hypothetical protein, conserved [Trypanosoma brucei gambiense DAL972]